MYYECQKTGRRVIDGILAWKILETFDAHYADDVVMSVNEKDERVENVANQEYELKFWQMSKSFMRLKSHELRSMERTLR